MKIHQTPEGLKKSFSQEKNQVVDLGRVEADLNEHKPTRGSLKYKNEFKIESEHWETLSKTNGKDLKFSAEGSGPMKLIPVFSHFDFPKKSYYQDFRGVTGYYFPQTHYVVLVPLYVYGEPGTDTSESVNWWCQGFVAFRLILKK